MYIPEDGWELHPIGGRTGDAYMGIRNNEKVFLKRNTSPFISALSAEGITPKLMWTQRTYSGDTLVAQEWKQGHVLQKDDMANSNIKALIKHIHQSNHLLTMLRRVGGQEFQPLDFIELYFKDLPHNLVSHQYFNKIIHFLEDQVHEEFYQVPTCVCHGDLNHHNFLFDTNHQKLYLVDWENVRIADPLSDLTYLLIQYFPPSQWASWFASYDLEESLLFKRRVTWYSLLNCLLLAKNYYIEGRFDKVNEMVLLIQSIFNSQQKQDSQKRTRRLP